MLSSLWGCKKLNFDTFCIVFEPFWTQVETCGYINIDRLMSLMKRLMNEQALVLQETLLNED
jgi:hypothetical protein